MLVLTRRIGETLTIGGSVSVTVLGIDGNQVSIGTDAPPGVAIVRHEILDRGQRRKTFPPENK